MSEKFHERFNIEISAEEARKRFVNRAYNQIFEWSSDPDSRRAIANALGERYMRYSKVEKYIGNNFDKCLQAIEAVSEQLDDDDYNYLEARIANLLSAAEVDLGIRWEGGRFLPAGAKVLDERLVNESLHWLREKGYESVLSPFEKGLNQFLHSTARPVLLADAVTDMYESLEALAKIVTGQNKDLSANREKFISEVKASEPYKKILRAYISYANQFRHAAQEGKPKPKISQSEAESFIYLTGVFIRLAMA
jgi:hypothetical protein